MAGEGKIANTSQVHSAFCGLLIGSGGCSEAGALHETPRLLFPLSKQGAHRLGTHTPLQPRPTADPLQPRPTADPLQPCPTAVPLQPRPTAVPLQSISSQSDWWIRTSEKETPDS